MPWTTPTLKTVRENSRAYIEAALPESDATIPNSVLRVMSDVNSAVGHLNLQYLDWQVRQYLPDTAETEFLDRWGYLYLVNSDGSKGRKQATFATGTAAVADAQADVTIPAGTILISGGGEVSYQTTADAITGTSGDAELSLIVLT